MRVIGIDPGTALTVAVLDFIERGVAVVDMIDGARLATQTKGATGWVNQPALLVEAIRSVQHRGPIYAVVEATALRSAQGLASQSRYVGSGWLARGVLAAMGVRTVVVEPGVWKRHFKLKAPTGASPTAVKEASRQLALQKFPGAAALLARKMDHNRAEALLLALWGWETQKWK